MSGMFDLILLAIAHGQVRMRALQKDKMTSKIVQHRVLDPLAEKEERERAEAAQMKLSSYTRIGAEVVSCSFPPSPLILISLSSQPIFLKAMMIYWERQRFVIV